MKNTEFKDKLISINRITKVVKGGRRFQFSALVVVGDQTGSIGIGHGKAKQVPDAIKKATEKAKVKALEQIAPVHVNSQTQSVCAEITQPKERVVYIEKPVYVEKKIYVNRPIRTVRHVQRRVVHRSSNNNMPDPASCYLACVKGDCRCYSAMLAQRQRDNSLFGMNNGQLMGLFYWGTMLYSQFGR